eukprot:250932_1
MASVFGALLFSLFAIKSQFLSNDEDDYKIMIKLSNGVNVISMQSLLASSCRIVAIFMWKQSHKTWKSKGRAVEISMSPKIKWIDDINTTTEQHVAKVIAVAATNNAMDSVRTQKVTAIIDLRSAQNGENYSESSESM